MYDGALLPCISGLRCIGKSKQHKFKQYWFKYLNGI